MAKFYKITVLAGYRSVSEPTVRVTEVITKALSDANVESEVVEVMSSLTAASQHLRLHRVHCLQRVTVYADPDPEDPESVGGCRTFYPLCNYSFHADPKGAVTIDKFPVPSKYLAYFAAIP